MSKKTAYLNENLIKYEANIHSDLININLEGFNYDFNIFYQDGQIVLKNTETGRSFYCHKTQEGISLNGRHLSLSGRRPRLKGSEDGVGENLATPMPGKIIKIYVKQGDIVSKGDKLFSMEAMKMEHTITAPEEMTVVNLHAGEGDQVEAGIYVVELESKGK